MRQVIATGRLDQMSVFIAFQYIRLIGTRKNAQNSSRPIRRDLYGKKFFAKNASTVEPAFEPTHLSAELFHFSAFPSSAV
ncbi:MAG TPA: hypothetical protein DEB39_02865 [Planctomycetaceae bacterium]|nr:hypothetical protein [Planctomycetaceae bacterium]